MTKLGVTTLAAFLALAGVLAGASPAATGASSKTSPFTASYAGRAIVRTTGESTAAISANGTGKGNVVGASKLVGTGVGIQGDPCASFSGKGTITTKTGKLNIVVPTGAKACPGATDENQNALTGTVKVAGGTGTFKKAKGTLKLTGNYDRGTGKFTVSFKGAISM